MALPLYQKKDRIRQLEKEQFNLGLAPEEYRDCWRRDYARLIHSPSFRRLQGKTQLFPGVESDFFRNRLTHSLEVAQIAKSIAIRLNHNYNSAGGERKKGQKGFGISTDLVDMAALAHDLGHPPFGHQGEEALDECMKECGGFEGNAQTIRILSKIEKKFKVENQGFDEDKDIRIGLNLCMRSYASILKYDFVIPDNLKDRIEYAESKGYSKISPVKGYYKCDEEIVNKVKSSILKGYRIKKGEFKTLECTIMDIADDIAYSTYDLEDAFKAGFISPLDLLHPSKELIKKVTEKVNKNLIKEGVKKTLTEDNVIDLIRENILPLDNGGITEGFAPDVIGTHFDSFANSVVELHYRTAKLIAKNGSIRTGFTSSIVGRFIRGVKMEYESACPALSRAHLDDDTRILVEILKTFTYTSQIMSPKLKIAEFRGKEIVTKIFNTLIEPGIGEGLMPDDVQEIYNKAKGAYKQRIVCDYIASMTDKYAIEFYGRLISEKPETIFKPY